MESNKIGTRIRQKRIASGYTQLQFAEKLDISVNYLSAIERGVKTPKLETFIALANALGASADELLMDVVHQARELKISNLSEQMSALNEVHFTIVTSVVETLIRELKENQT